MKRRISITRFRRSMKVGAVLILTILVSIGANAAPPEKSRNGMVVSAHPLASQAGIAMLKQGGNAVDAAVATAFALGVVEQYSSGIGGGSLILIRLAETGETVAIDARETAPLAATRNMYIRDGKFESERSLTGILAGGVPGTVAGMAMALERYGTMSLKEVLAPSIRYAVAGFHLSERHVNAIKGSHKKLAKFLGSAKIYLPNGQPPQAGSLFVQEDLAWAYRQIAEHGADAFYRGEIAKKIVDFMVTNNGPITAKDLAKYQAKIRKPITGTYRGYDILSMPPPSSGGIHLVQILNILEAYELKALERNSVEAIHIIAEAMKLAFADRAHYLGDSDFVDVPISGLTAKAYAKELRSKIRWDEVLELEADGNPLPYEGANTTHLSVLDRHGNAVSITQTVNTGFGSGMIIAGTGIILNNEMDDFSVQPGVPNIYGLIGAEANAIAPQKRPLSSMSPTIVLKDGNLFMVIGSPGGPRIITTVLQVIINVIDYGLDIQDAIDAPRIHHQWRPDLLRLEEAHPVDRDALKKLGHQIRHKGKWSVAQGIVLDVQTGVMYGGSDYRIGDGSAIGWTE